MGAKNMGSLQNQRGFRGQGSKQTLVDRSVFSVAPQAPPDERFARNRHQQWKSQRLQLGEPRDQGVVLLEPFAKAESRIECQVFALDSRPGGGFLRLAEFSLDP